MKISNFLKHLMLKAFKTGILTGLSQWRIALIVYFFQLLLAVMLGVQVYHVLEASIGNSLELNKLLGNYDHTVISDLLNVHWASISPLLGQLWWLASTYLVFSIFINGGILFAVVKDEKSWLTFWIGGATYFFRFLKLGLFFLLIFAIISAALWLPFLGFFLTSAEYLSSEKISVWLLFLMLFIYLFILIFLFSWALIARLKIIREDSRIWPAIRSSFTWAFRHHFSVNFLVLLFFLLHIFIYWIYWTINDTGLVSLWWVVFFMLLQQAVAFLRVMVRVMAYGGISSYADVQNFVSRNDATHATF